MKLVVDTNVLFTFFWKESVFHQLITTKQLTLYAPEYALQELHKHRQEIRAKTNLSEKEFIQTLHELEARITFMSESVYQDEFGVISKHLATYVLLSNNNFLTILTF